MRPMLPPSWLILWASGTTILLAIYTLIFAVTGSPLGSSVLFAIANVGSLSALALVAHALLRAFVLSLTVERQIAVHAIAAPVFALTWYSLAVVLLAFFEGLWSGNYSLQGFSGPAFVWQTFQGLILYALVAAICYAIQGGRKATPANIVEHGPKFDRYLVRDGEGMSPIAVGAIVTITGAQDYSEVCTNNGRHLVRLSLSEFEQRLDNSLFLRVHRSAIINFSRLEHAEPAGGGRMLAHMDNGDMVQVSRSGAALLRNLVV